MHQTSTRPWGFLYQGKTRTRDSASKHKRWLLRTCFCTRQHPVTDQTATSERYHHTAASDRMENSQTCMHQTSQLDKCATNKVDGDTSDGTSREIGQWRHLRGWNTHILTLIQKPDRPSTGWGLLGLVETQALKHRHVRTHKHR